MLSFLQNSLMIGVLPRVDVGAFLSGINSAAQFHAFMGAAVLSATIYCAVFYFVTRWFHCTLPI